MTNERKTVRLLSIDGGGIRGLIPAMILAGMQRMLGSTPLVDLFDAQASIAAEELMMLMPRKHDGQPNRFRFQATLAAANEKMDDVSPENLAALQKDAQDLLETKKDEFKEVCERLLSTD